MKLIIPVLMLFVFSTGIYSQSQWVKTNGLTGGAVNCILEDGARLYAGTNGAIFKSTNSGTAFLPSGLYDHQVIQIALLNSRLYAVDGNYLLFRSANEGSSWNDISSNIPGGACQEIIIHKNTLFAVTPGNGVYRSTNNGNDWLLLNKGISTGYFSSSLSTSSYLFLNDGKTIYRSSNKGTGWETLVSDLPEYYSINKFGSFNNFIYANLNTATGSLLFRSSNNGANWTAISNWNPSHYINSFSQNGNSLYCSEQRNNNRYS
jgi:photosystem II stability/assembly factor-like uncharacterized protein